MKCQQERKEEIPPRLFSCLQSPILAVAIVGDIDITNDTKKVITKMKQNSQLIFLNGDFSYSEDEHDTRQWFSSLFTIEYLVR